MVDFYDIHVGKYTSPMDPMGLWEMEMSGGFITMKVPSRELTHIPPWVKENHQVSAFSGRYVSFQEGISYHMESRMDSYIWNVILSDTVDGSEIRITSWGW